MLAPFLEVFPLDVGWAPGAANVSPADASQFGALLLRVQNRN